MSGVKGASQASKPLKGGSERVDSRYSHGSSDHHHQRCPVSHQNPHGGPAGLTRLPEVSAIEGSQNAARHCQPIIQQLDNCLTVGSTNIEQWETTSRRSSDRSTEPNVMVEGSDQGNLPDVDICQPCITIRSHPKVGSGDNQTQTTIDLGGQLSRHSDRVSKNSTRYSETDSEYAEEKVNVQSTFNATGEETRVTERDQCIRLESGRLFCRNFCNHSNDPEDKAEAISSKRNTALYIEQDVITKQRREIHLLMEELGTRDKELNDLVKSHQLQIKAWENDRERLDQLQERLTKYEDQLKHSDNQLKETLAEMASVCEKRELDASTLQKNRIEIEELMRKVKENSGYINDIERENEYLGDRMRTLTAGKQEMEERESDLLQIIKQKDEMINKKHSQAELAREDARCMKQSLETLEEKHANLITELNAWKEKYCVAKDQSDRLIDEAKAKDAAVEKSTQQLHESLEQAVALQKALFTSCEREKCKEELLLSLRKQQKRTAHELSNLRELFDRQNRDMAFYNLSGQDNTGKREPKEKSPKNPSRRGKSSKKDMKNKNSSKCYDHGKNCQGSFPANAQIPQDEMVEEGTSTTELTAGDQRSQSRRGNGHVGNKRSDYGVDVKPTISSSWKNSRLVSPSKSCSHKNRSRNASHGLSSSMQASTETITVFKSVRAQSTSPMRVTQEKGEQTFQSNPWAKQSKVGVGIELGKDPSKDPTVTCRAFDSSSDVSQLWSPIERLDEELTPADSDGMCHELSRALPQQNKNGQLIKTPAQSPDQMTSMKRQFSVSPNHHKGNGQRSDFSKSSVKDNKEPNESTNPRTSSKQNKDFTLSSGADDEATPKASPHLRRKSEKAHSLSPMAKRRSTSPNKRSQGPGSTRRERSPSSLKRTKFPSGKNLPANGQGSSEGCRESTVLLKGKVVGKHFERQMYENELSKPYSTSEIEPNRSRGKRESKVKTPQKTQASMCDNATDGYLTNATHCLSCDQCVEQDIGDASSHPKPKLSEVPSKFKSSVPNVGLCCETGRGTEQQCKHKASCTESLSRVDSLYSAKSRFSTPEKCWNNNRASDSSFTDVTDDGYTVLGPQCPPQEANVCILEDPSTRRHKMILVEQNRFDLEAQRHQSKEEQCFSKAQSCRNWKQRKFLSSGILSSSSDAHLSSSDEGWD